MPYENLINMVAPDSLSNRLANIFKPLLYMLGIKNSILLKAVKKYRVRKNSRKYEY